MKYRTIKDTGIEVSAVALGTWAVGGGTWWGDSDESESVKAIQAALDEGITLIDTAPAYGFGKSEEIVGKAVEGRRDKAIISTKCGLWWKDSRGSFKFEQGGRRVHICLRPETIREEVEMSLTRLKTDYIDIYHTHWQADEADPVPIADTMELLLKLKEEGKIRGIAASNITSSQIDEYEKTGSLDAIQPRYSMLDRKIEGDLLPHCRAKRISTLVYSPLEQGLLAGKFRKDTPIPEGQYRNFLPWFQPGNRERVIDMLEGWEGLLEKYSCTFSQLVIAWTVAQEGITTALCGGRKVSHVIENAAAGSLNLDPDDILRMRKDAEQVGSLDYQGVKGAKDLE